jgi:hypothetical protein
MSQASPWYGDASSCDAPALNFGVSARRNLKDQRLDRDLDDAVTDDQRSSRPRSRGKTVWNPTETLTWPQP